MMVLSILLRPAVVDGDGRIYTYMNETRRSSRALRAWPLVWPSLSGQRPGRVALGNLTPGLPQNEA